MSPAKLIMGGLLVLVLLVVGALFVACLYGLLLGVGGVLFGDTLFDRACGLLLLGIPAGGGLAICTGALCYAWLELLKLL